MGIMDITYIIFIIGLIVYLITIPFAAMILFKINSDKDIHHRPDVIVVISAFWFFVFIYEVLFSKKK